MGLVQRAENEEPTKRGWFDALQTHEGMGCTWGQTEADMAHAHWSEAGKVVGLSIGHVRLMMKGDSHEAQVDEMLKLGLAIVTEATRLMTEGPT